MTELQIASLAIFAVSIAISIVVRINIGIVGFVAAFLVASLAGLNLKAVLSAFPGNLVVLIIGITLLFAHVQKSGAVDWMTQKALRITGNRWWLIPWVGFVLAAILATIGGLPAAVVAIVYPIISGLARKNQLNYLMMVIMANWAAIAAGMSPLSPAGALLQTLAGKADIYYSPWLLYGIVMLVFTVLSLIVYVLCKGGRYTGLAAGNPFSGTSPASAWRVALAPSGAESLPKEHVVSNEQRPAYRAASLAAFLILIIAAVVLHLNIGLVALTLAFLLQAAFQPPEKEMLSHVAWSVVLLLAGLLIYLHVLSEIGTLKAIQSALHGIGAPVLAILAVSYITAIFSNVDSSTIVILGVMAPLGLSLAAGSGMEGLAMLVTVAVSTAVISMSPVHIDGSLMIANSPRDDGPELFRKLIYLSLVVTAIVPGLIAIFPIMAR